MNPAAPILLVGRGSERQASGETNIDAVVDPDPEQLTATVRRLLHLTQESGQIQDKDLPHAAD